LNERCLENGFSSRILPATWQSLIQKKERRRLADHYAGLSEGELQELAAAADSLTELAREALKFELSRRGLEIALQDPTVSSHQPSSSGPITLRRVRDLPDALLAKSILDFANIECYLIDENTIRMNWLWSNALDGIKLWVRPEDADAGELLDQDCLEAFHVEGVGEYKQPRRPNRRSFDISFKELVRQVAYASLFLMWLTSFPLPIRFNHCGWKCRS